MLSLALFVFWAAPDAPEFGPLDIAYSTIRQERSGATWRSYSLRTRLVLDGGRVYFFEQVTGGTPGLRLPGREFLNNGELVYVSNALGMTTVYDARRMETFESNLFLSSYADAIGYDVPNTRPEVGDTTARFHRSLACSDHTFRVDFDGARWLTFHTTDGRTSTWRLDLVDGQWVVTRGEVRLRSRLLCRWTNADFVQVGSSWLPRVVTWEEFDPSAGDAAPLAVEDMYLEAYIPTATAFPTVPFFMGPGTVVRDARYGAEATASGGFLAYRVPVSIEALERAWKNQFGAVPKERTLPLSPTGVLAGLGASLLAFVMRRKLA